MTFATGMLIGTTLLSTVLAVLLVKQPERAKVAVKAKTVIKGR